MYLSWHCIFFFRFGALCDTMIFGGVNAMFYHYSANQPNYEYYNIALANARKRFTYLVQGYVLETYLLKKIERRMARNAKVIKNITAALSVGAILSMILATFGYLFLSV